MKTIRERRKHTRDAEYQAFLDLLARRKGPDERSMTLTALAGVIGAGRTALNLVLLGFRCGKETWVKLKSALTPDEFRLIKAYAERKYRERADERGVPPGRTPVRNDSVAEGASIEVVCDKCGGVFRLSMKTESKRQFVISGEFRCPDQTCATLQRVDARIVLPESLNEVAATTNETVPSTNESCS